MTIANTSSHRKPAETHHPIHELIRERWSPRAFANRPVEAEKLHSLFEAARWAASTANQQPWYFILGSKEHPEDHARLVSILWERNVVWAQHAPVLVLTVAKLYEHAGREHASLYDLGMAVGNLVTQAVDLGLVTHQMGGFSPEKAHEELGIPQGYEPVAVIAIGYPDSPEALPEELRERERAPRSRKPLKEFVFEGRWQQSAQAELSPKKAN